MDFELPDFGDLDMEALGFAAVAVLAMGFFMFSGSFGWDTYPPVWMKTLILVMAAPVVYAVAVWRLNK